MSDRLSKCFTRQLELLNKFHVIELANLPDTYQPSSGSYSFNEADFNSYAGQRRLRELAWRVVEEVGEMIDAERSADRLKEVADIFHFLLEFFLIAEVTIPHPLIDDDESDRLQYWFSYPTGSGFISPWLRFVAEISLAINELKNRGWKQTPRVTNLTQFKFHARRSFHAFVSACQSESITLEALLNAYFGKADENAQRIQDGV